MVKDETKVAENREGDETVENPSDRESKLWVFNVVSLEKALAVDQENAEFVP